MRYGVCFCFNDTATTEIYTLSRHDALPISVARAPGGALVPRRPHVLRHLQLHEGLRQDRKSTRLNSSHANISYAVFCLKKKKQPLSSASPKCRTRTPTTIRC